MTRDQPINSDLELVNTGTPLHYHHEDLAFLDPGKQVVYEPGKQLGAPHDGIEPIINQDPFQQELRLDDDQQEKHDDKNQRSWAAWRTRVLIGGPIVSLIILGVILGGVFGSRHHTAQHDPPQGSRTTLPTMRLRSILYHTISPQFLLLQILSTTPGCTIKTRLGS